jgi:hypothetical protein
MARPLKTGVDYFPLDVVMEDEVELIESEHKIIGFAVLLKLYQKIYATNYWIKWDKKAVIVFSKRINVDINAINAIINSCLEWSLFDKKLYDKYSILTSNGIQKRFFEIVKRRKEIPVIQEYLLTEIEDSVDINLINVDKSTQSKGKKTKGDKIKTSCPEKFPITEQMINYAKEKNFLLDLENLTEGFLIHHRANGNKFVNWYSAWQKWLRNDMDFYPDKHKQQDSDQEAFVDLDKLDGDE